MNIFLQRSLGASLMGLSVFTLSYICNRITGISGIIRRAIKQQEYFSLFYLFGFGIGSIIVGQFAFSLVPQIATDKTSLLGALFVGLGAKWANGCTSGHMLCGVSQLSLRSFVATFMFMFSAFIIRLLFPRAAVSGISWSADSIDSFSFLFLLFPSLFLLLGAWGLQKFHLFVAFVCGFTFSVGLALSGMADAGIVVGFLDLVNPTLLFVIAFALIPNMIYNIWKTRKGIRMNNVTTELVIGSAIFGCGWGLCGVCPGPSLIHFFNGNTVPATLVMTLFIL